MTKTSRNTAAAAEESFHKHYAAIWGEQRWLDSLYPALSGPTRYAALVNRYASISDFWQAIAEAGIDRKDLEELRLPRNDSVSPSKSNGILCFARAASPSEPAAFPPPQPAMFSKLLTHWNLDAASALVAHLLDVQPGESVLDLCAAPGGKSIALAQSMFPTSHAEATPVAITTTPTGVLRSNEADGRRQKKLAENLQAYLPGQLIKQGNLQCLHVDGTSTSANALLAPGRYDKVLVDAPCSSERHIVHAHIKAKAAGNTAPEMANWRAGSSKRLAQTQLSLLTTALKAARVGGKVMYATCSIEMTENDGVIEKMLVQVEKEKKKGARWSVKLGFAERGDDEASLEGHLSQWAEKTKYGWMVLPDHPENGRWGPLFFAMITKINGTTISGLLITAAYAYRRSMSSAQNQQAQRMVSQTANAISEREKSAAEQASLPTAVSESGDAQPETGILNPKLSTSSATAGPEPVSTATSAMYMDIAKYSRPGEDLDWTESTDLIERLRMQSVISSRKYAAKRRIEQVNMGPSFRLTSELQPNAVLVNASLSACWEVPHSREAAVPLFARPDHLRYDQLLHHVFGNRDVMLRYFPRELNGRNLVDVAEEYSDQAIANAINVARSADDQMTESDVRRHLATALCLYTSTLPPADLKDFSKLHGYMQRRENKMRLGELKSFSPPELTKQHYILAVFNQCMAAFSQWAATTQDFPDWVSIGVDEMCGAVEEDLVNGPWTPQKERFLAAKEVSYNNAMGALAEWVNEVHWSAESLVAYIRPDVMHAFGSDWRKAEILLLWGWKNATDDVVVPESEDGCVRVIAPTSADQQTGESAAEAGLANESIASNETDRLRFRQAWASLSKGLHPWTDEYEEAERARQAEYEANEESDWNFASSCRSLH